MQDFAGKTALVTGNSGTGKAAAQQLAERGAHVIPSGRDKARGDAAAAETRSAEVTEVRNVIVIGSGPAGYTAALYAARAQLRPLVFEGGQAGGALMNTTDVENFPGFPEGIMGPELMDPIRKQAERFGAELVTDDVIAVDLTGDAQGGPDRRRRVYRPRGDHRDRLGYKKLGVPGEERLSGHGVSWCATCDGFFFRDQDIAVVGGGDTAHGGGHVPDPVRQVGDDRAPARLAARPQDHAGAGVRQRQDHVRVGLRGGRGRSATTRSPACGCANIEDRRGAGARRDRLVRRDRPRPAHGAVPRPGRLDDEGYVLVDAAVHADRTCRASSPAGDVVDHTYRQAVTAAGTGCAAALDAERWLAGKET